jgi:cysteine desulfurase / selenocysteine lyase
MCATMLRMPDMDIARCFGPFGGRIWMNCAHQGPLPQPAVAAAQTALGEKVAPARLHDDAFLALPRRLKESLARLIGAPADEIVLGNSASYGLNLLVQGLPLSRGDEVLLVAGDYPATITPWLPLRRHGVAVRLLEPRARPLTAEELDAHLRPATRVFCSSWVFSLTGEAIDLESIGRLCRERGVVCAINGSQGVGARPIDVSGLSIDALVSCGYKWLCGPYATGFCWLRPELADDLRYEQGYWLAQMADADLSHDTEPRLRDDLGAARYDVFGTANFLNFAPWRESVELFLAYGIERVAAHDQALVGRLVDGLTDTEWELESPRDEPARSTLVLLRHDDADRVARAYDALLAGGVDIAQRAGRLRFSPHVFNTPAEIDRALEVLFSAP